MMEQCSFTTTINNNQNPGNGDEEETTENRRSNNNKDVKMEEQFQQQQTSDCSSASPSDPSLTESSIVIDEEQEHQSLMQCNITIVIGESEDGEEVQQRNQTYICNEQFSKDEAEDKHLSTSVVVEPQHHDHDEHDVEQQTNNEDRNNTKTKQKICTRRINVSPAQRQWLENLKPELETMTVLYAKSIFGSEMLRRADEQQQQHHGRGFIRLPIYDRPMSQSIVDTTELAHTRMQKSATKAPSNFQQQTVGAGKQHSPLTTRSRLRVTRIDRMDKHNQLGNNNCNEKNGADNDGMYCSTICILPTTRRNSTNTMVTDIATGTVDDDGSFVPTAQSLVMCRSSRVEIDPTRTNQPITTIKTDPIAGGATCNWPETTQMALTKFARSLPNGSRLCEQFDADVDENRKEMIDDGQEKFFAHAESSTSTEPFNSAKTANCSTHIYRPNIRYRRMCTGKDRRKTATGAAAALINLTQYQSDNLPLIVRPIGFRHSIHVNNEQPQQEMENDDDEQHFVNTNDRIMIGKEPTLNSRNSCNGDHSSSHLPLFYSTFKNNDNNQKLRNHQNHAAQFSSTLCQPTLPQLSSSSPPEEIGSNSTDSGQCSNGDSPPYCGYSTIAMNNVQFQDRRRRRTVSSSDTASSLETTHEWVAATRNGHNKYVHQQPAEFMLPSYARTANTIDQALRISSTIFNHLSSSPLNVSNKLFAAIRTFIQLLEQSSCARAMSHTHIELVRCALFDAETNLKERTAGNSATISTTANTKFNNYLAICVRQMLESSMIVFVKILCRYLAQCTNHDRLLLIGLEHLVHLLLFGDELCVEAVRAKAVDNLLALCLMPMTSADTLKLLLRALAVLCGTAKGCLQLLSIGGLDFVLQVLCESVHVDCSFEAAGCLAQLCSPAHSFVRPSAQVLVPRLLQLVDNTHLPESLLLCLAALANLCAQCQGPVGELLYENNAILRLIRSAQRPQCASNPHVQEQLVTILTRMANRGYERALLAQGAVPILCKMLLPSATSSPIGHGMRQVELEKRIVYKAAVCLGCLASTGSGLRALNEQGVYQVLLQISRPENKQQTMTPVQLICASIRQKLEHTYNQLGTAV